MGCLFRIKTMGDFYRLADTAFIQYILDSVGKKSILSTCDGYNAINAFSSNNLTTIYRKPPHNFTFHSGNNKPLTPEERIKMLVEKEKREEEKRKN